MNIAPLRKEIIKESIIFIGIAVLLVAITGYLDSVLSDYTQKTNSATGSANQLLSERQATESKFISVKDNLPVFQESLAYEKNPGLFIDSQAIRDLFNEYQIRYFLKKLSVEMQPVTPVTEDPKYARTKFITTRSSVRLNVEALTDEDIYLMLGAIQKELPGFIKIRNFSIFRRMDVDKVLLGKIRAEGPQPVVTADIELDWYGMRSTDANSAFNSYVAKKDRIP